MMLDRLSQYVLGIGVALGLVTVARITFLLVVLPGGG